VDPGNLSFGGCEYWSLLQGAGEQLRRQQQTVRHRVLRQQQTWRHAGLTSQSPDCPQEDSWPAGGTPWRAERRGRGGTAHTHRSQGRTSQPSSRSSSCWCTHQQTHLAPHQQHTQEMVEKLSGAGQGPPGIHPPAPKVPPDLHTEKNPGLHRLQAGATQPGKQPRQSNTASQLLAATDTAWTAAHPCCTEPTPLHQNSRLQPCCQLPILPVLLCRSGGKWTAWQMRSGQEAGCRQRMAVVSAAACRRLSWAELAEL
jgi:hypothetical protein